MTAAVDQQRVDSRGRRLGNRGRPPFGTRPGERENLDLIEALIRGGWGPGRIATQLNRIGVPTRYGAPWRPSTLERFLARTRDEKEATPG